ncbi:hypothetical protein N7468_006105 [Penicillium chermesinum]|uniref:RTA1 domain protein n=1 Tax=Penicillium chermesinum TaxID=63820 RepID=A0A9W9P087_9EURO|nr:uncharacterized protein N7468_006105 [Penicillium chermesinum]KAJ5233149.1 hypothetical protein N7468_006105 [Penicillium chermesinum]KAJ6172785.1 hypothetical protein N7470_001852 [Penicillium chermesinum]
MGTDPYDEGDITAGNVVYGSIYLYAPNKVAPIVFCIIFFLSLVGHLFQCQRYHAWGMIGLHTLAATLYVAGYGLRAYGSHHYIYNPAASDSSTVLLTYIMSQVFIYVCPPLLELSNYHVLSRVFYYVPYHTPIKPGRVFLVFGTLMSIVEFFNGLGVAFSSNPKGHEQGAGRALVLVSLAIQICVIGTFFALSAMFFHRCRRAGVHNKAIPSMIYVLWCSMVFILIRTIFRVVEHSGNTTRDMASLREEMKITPLDRYEWYFYLFEGATMLANSLWWNLFSPGRFLPRTTNTWIGEDNNEVSVEPPRFEERTPLSQAGRTFMQIITLGMWGQMFPKQLKQTSGSFTELDDYSGRRL